MKKTTKKKTVRKKTPRKKHVNANKQHYDGIDFDSTPEMSMYILLKRAGIKFKYIGQERAKYKLLTETKYEGESFERPQRRSKQMKDTPKISETGYTPDFVGEDEQWFIEVKGRKVGDFNLRWKLFKRFLNERKHKPLLFMPVTGVDMQQVINILKQKGYATEQD